MRYGNVRAGLCLRRGSRRTCSPVPCFQAAGMTLVQAGVTHFPLPPSLLSSLCSGCRAREQGSDFRSGFCCEGGSWKTRLNAVLTFPLALLAKLWQKNRAEMEKGERMQILAHKEILHYILVDQNTNQLKTTGVHQHAHKSFITIIQG